MPRGATALSDVVSLHLPKDGSGKLVTAPQCGPKGTWLGTSLLHSYLGKARVAAAGEEEHLCPRSPRQVKPSLPVCMWSVVCSRVRVPPRCTPRWGGE